MASLFASFISCPGCKAWLEKDKRAEEEERRFEEDEQQGEGGFDENELEHDDEDEPLFQVDAEGLGDGGEADRMM